MRRLVISGIVVAATAAGAPLRAQDPFNVAVPVDQLSTLLTTLYGPGGLVVDSRTLLPNGDTHSAHFNSAFQSGFTQFNVALATQLASAPLPSPASGFTYEFDPDLGIFNRSTVSFGPIFTERPRRSAPSVSPRGSRSSNSVSTRSRAWISTRYPRSSPTTASSRGAAGAIS